MTTTIVQGEDVNSNVRTIRVDSNGNLVMRLIAIDAGPRVDVATELETLALDGFESGVLARSVRPRALWSLVVEGAGISTLEGEILANGDARWLRLRIQDPAYSRIDTWYVSSTGDWTATGVAQNEAITMQEVLRRLSGRVDVPVQVRVQDDLELDLDLVEFQAPPEPSAWLEFTGADGRVTETTGVVTTYTAAEPGERGELIATLAAGVLGDHVGKFCRVTSGPRAGARFAIMKATTNGAEVTVPQQTDYFGDPVEIEPDDEFVIETFPTIQGRIHASGPFSANFTDLRLGNSGLHDIWLQSRTWYINACVFDGGADLTGGNGQVLASYVAGGTGLRVTTATCLVALCGIASGAAFRARENGRLWVDQTLSYSPLLIQPTGQATVTGGSWFGVLDAASALRIDPGGSLHAGTFDVGQISPGILWAEDLAPSMGDARAVVLGSLRYDASEAPALNGTGQEFLIGGDAKSLGDLPYAAANGSMIYTIE